MTRSFPYCLLCKSRQVHPSQAMTSADIIRGWEVVGAHFREESIARLKAEGEVELYECEKCGFRFFDCELAGNSSFYEDVFRTVPGYYASNWPENDRNARYARAHGFKTILDVGCGSGLALDAARQFGLETYGIELSSTAAAECRGKGHVIFPFLLHEMDSKWEGCFDLISLNQVIEHVRDPVQVVKDCARFISPHGVVAIAVPNDKGVIRLLPWMEHNWPPHHVSRWRRKDLQNLARIAGMKVLKLGGQQLLGSELERILIDRSHYSRTLKRPTWLIPDKLARALSFLYRKMGMKYLFRAQGHSIYCFLQPMNTAAKSWWK